MLQVGSPCSLRTDALLTEGFCRNSVYRKRSIHFDCEHLPLVLSSQCVLLFSILPASNADPETQLAVYKTHSYHLPSMIDVAEFKRVSASYEDSYRSMNRIAVLECVRSRPNSPASYY